MAVQTDASTLKFEAPEQSVAELSKDDGANQPEHQLSAAELSSILKWSKIISADINLASGVHCLIYANLVLIFIHLALRRLTEISAGIVTFYIFALVPFN